MKKFYNIIKTNKLMTAKEKALELYKKFNRVETPSEMNFEGKINLHNLSFLAAKECALICVNEILDKENFIYHTEGFMDYWEEVKLEIENL